MTYKQLRILQSALELFSKEGYHATSTSKVAKQAGVSEGLVFKHFKNKAGLLSAILEEGEKRLKTVYADVVMESDPKAIIRKAINMPFSIKITEYDFWKLQFKLRWELDMNESELSNPLLKSLEQAFEMLDYSNPKKEAESLLFHMNGITEGILRGTSSNNKELQEFLIAKYQV